MDSDLIAFYKEGKEIEKEKRRKRLAEADTTGFKRHTAHHFSRDLAGHRLDYWPSTGKFMWRGKVHHRGDVHEFIRRHLENNDG